MERSVLFFDIDGTLLSEVNHEVPRSAVRALKQAQKKGHLLFINTGRTVCSIPSEIRRIGFDGFMCGCGTCMVYRDEIVFSSSIPEERGNEIIREASRCGIGCVAEGMEDVYFPERMTRFDSLEMSRRYFRRRGMGGDRPLEQGGFSAAKFFVYSDSGSDVGRFLDFVAEDMDAIDRGDGTYEIVQKGYSKGTACGYVLDKFGIPLERAYVFGDSSNDLTMFEFAIHTVAMENHSAILDPCTEFVTRTVEEDGIEYALLHYGLI